MASVSFGKRVGEGTSQAVERIAQVSAAKSLDAKLRDVERALAKLDEGSYGTCDRCGEAIARERLEAIPWAVRCVSVRGGEMKAGGSLPARHLMLHPTLAR